MAQATLNVRMDKDLKKQFAQFCDSVGMSMSTAVSLFAKNTVKNKELPFRITSRRRKIKDPFWSEENQARLLESMKEIEKTGGTTHELEDLYD